MTDDLVAFLRARLDDDEQAARATAWDGSGNSFSWELSASATVEVGGDSFYAGDRTVANHIERHDPARVLADVEAWRTVLTQYERLKYDVMPDDLTGVWAIETIMRAKAAVYADHPDYREE